MKTAFKLKQTQGFTLIELVVSVVVMGVLVAIAIPAYTDHMIKTRRSDGQAALLQMAALMEQYYAREHTYVGATPTTLGTGTLSSQGYYNLSVANTTATTYTLNAAATGAQSKDTTCPTLSVNQANDKLPTPDKCWR